MSNLTWQAPPEGRIWWEWSALLVSFLAVGIVTWMAIGSIFGLGPLIEEPPLPDYSRLLMPTFLVADTLTAAGLVLMAAVILGAAYAAPRSRSRGLWILLVGALVAAACASVGGLILFHGDRYYWGLVALRLLRAGMVVLATTEWMLHPTDVVRA